MNKDTTDTDNTTTYNLGTNTLLLRFAGGFQTSIMGNSLFGPQQLVVLQANLQVLRSSELSETKCDCMRTLWLFPETNLNSPVDRSFCV